jgi:hypothetical protein
VARHRRPPVDGPPAELQVFRPDDWLPDISPYWAWLNGYPVASNDLVRLIGGYRSRLEDFNPLDMLRERVAYRRGLSRPYGINP